MAVSANTLFHFTKLAGIEGILKSKGFYCQYSDEHFENILPTKNQYKFTYIPMLSFCDLTITQLSKDSVHTQHFGSYGIGLTKEWGIKNRVSPVLYVHKESRPTNQLRELIDKVKNIPIDRKEPFILTSKSELLDELIDSFKYIKPYKGRWHKGKKLKQGIKPVIYYNEREWRHCPKMEEYRVLSAEIEDNKTEKIRLNKLLKQNIIHFTPNDVKFIIIKSKKDIPRISKVIQDMDDVTESQKSELRTRIITFDEILEDF